MDFVTDLPPSKGHSGAVYDSIWVVVDRLTKMTHYVPTRKTIDAPTLAGLFIQEVVRLHGLPDSIVSDRGSVFTSKFWSSFCFYLKVRRKLSTAFHPQTDGQTERQNQTMEAYIRAYCNECQDDWATLLALAEFSYNNSVHSATKVTPFYANMGRHPRMDFGVAEHAGQAPKATEHAERMKVLHETLRNRLKEANEQYSEYYDKGRKDQLFKVGDMVWLDARNIKTKKPSKKLGPKRLGPYMIIDIIGKRAYKLKLPSGSRIHPVFNVALLEPFHMTKTQEQEEPNVEEVLQSQYEEETEWEVENLVNSRTLNERLEYLVKWKGYDDSENTWEPAGNLQHLTAKIRRFHRLHPAKPKKDPNLTTPPESHI